MKLPTQFTAQFTVKGRKYAVKEALESSGWSSEPENPQHLKGSATGAGLDHFK
jgi:hypothetical protein